ncbi:uncharacterized protein LOC132628469 [Lycium barbarum]|uniref:uncharacterized protein LOC132628469 n=1 Tax=Lycium barbarum TaxID=112863 RepID=UPI00293ECB15|nr:uncharacterized protein LOC132628469 [Lycium barbarum]
MVNPRQGKKVTPKVAGKGKGRGAGKVTSRLHDEDQIKDTRATKKPAAPSRPASPSKSSSSSDEESSSSSSSHSGLRQAITPPHRPQPPIRQPTAEEREQEREQERRETDIRMRDMYEQDLQFSVEGSEELYNKGCELAKHEGQGPKRSIFEERNPVQSLLGDDQIEDTVDEEQDEELEEDTHSLAKGKRRRATLDDENLDPILKSLDPFDALRPQNEEEEERRTLKKIRHESQLGSDTTGATSSSAHPIEPAHHTSAPPTETGTSSVGQPDTTIASTSEVTQPHDVTAHPSA